jgi:hypothetical protein
MWVPAWAGKFAMSQAANVDNVMSLKSRREKLEPQFIALYLRDRRLRLES